MSEKKKTTVAKALPRTVKTAEPPRTAAVAPAHTSNAQASNASNQLSAFESAIKLFHARNLQDARELFLQAAQGPERDVANRARLHVSMCDRRLQQVAPVSLSSAEEYYNYSIALLNTRNAAEARPHLEKALQMSPGADHILYALALAQAMGGDIAPAYDNLRRAIELEPRNRTLARQDADFVHLASQPPFDTLLYPEKKGW